MDTILHAVKLVEDNQINEALQLLQDYVGKANEDEQFTIAELYMQWGFLEEAAIILNQLLNKYPNESDIKINLAEIYIEEENDEAAIEILAEIDEDDPSFVPALIQQADLYQAQGLFEVAEQKLFTAKNILPNEAVIDFALGELYFSIGEFMKAVTYYENVITTKTAVAEVSIADRLAESYAAAGEYEKALDYFEEGTEASPDKFFKYGVTAIQAGRNDIAINAWEKVLELDEHYHTVYPNLAEALEEEGMLEEAYQTAIKGLELDEFNKHLFLRAGMIARQLQRDTEGETYIRQAIALDPEYKEAVLFLVEYLKEEDKHTEIIEMLTEIKSVGAPEALYEWELAKALNEEEDYTQALEAYNNAYLNLSDDPDFLKEYGYFLTEEGRIREAITVFKSYLTFIPDDDDIEAFYSRLKLTDDDEGGF